LPFLVDVEVQLTADIMQPDLIPLVPNQPVLEDFMDTIEETCFRSGMCRFCGSS
jgi:hypothetical protein